MAELAIKTDTIHTTRHAVALDHEQLVGLLGGAVRRVAGVDDAQPGVSTTVTFGTGDAVTAAVVVLVDHEAAPATPDATEVVAEPSAPAVGLIPGFGASAA